ncbi:CSF2R factor, partial [Sula dactylatra]|nr:CSF2R factor [Sula dactylatra]
MNCTWQAGRDAPGDTQYFLYWKNSKDDNEMECELYIKGENGRNTGCRFKNVRIQDDEAYFLVNGSSNGSVIQFYDEYIQLYNIEKLMPPSNITVNCDEIKNDCIIQWQQPQISHSNIDECFKHEINIKYKVRGISSPTFNINAYVCIYQYAWIERKINPWGNSHTFQRSNTRKKYLLKMRTAGTACFVSAAWGEWSAPVEFGK